jgi:hypothetical protein
MSALSNSIIESAVERFRGLVESLPPADVERFVSGALDVAFVESNPLLLRLRAKSIEDAHAELQSVKQVSALRAYLLPPTLAYRAPDLPPRPGVGILRDKILELAFGRSYQPPARPNPPARSTKASPTTRKRAGVRPAPPSADEVIAWLANAKRSEDAESILDLGTYKAPYLAIAKRLGIDLSGNERVVDLRRKIVVFAIESPLNHAALQKRQR